MPGAKLGARIEYGAELDKIPYPMELPFQQGRQKIKEMIMAKRNEWYDRGGTGC